MLETAEKNICVYSTVDMGGRIWRTKNICVYSTVDMGGRIWRTKSQNNICVHVASVKIKNWFQNYHKVTYNGQIMHRWNPIPKLMFDNPYLI